MNTDLIWTDDDDLALCTALDGNFSSAKIAAVMPVLRAVFPERSEKAISQHVYRIARWMRRYHGLGARLHRAVTIKPTAVERPSLFFADDPRALAEPRLVMRLAPTGLAHRVTYAGMPQ